MEAGSEGGRAGIGIASRLVVDGEGGKEGGSRLMFVL